MINPQVRSVPKSQSSLKRILKITLQVAVMVAIFAALLWYIGVGSLYEALLNIKVEYLALAFLMYFGINIFFTIRLMRVLAKGGVKTSFGKTLLAQYAGMLISDVTPGRLHFDACLPTRPKCSRFKSSVKHTWDSNHRVPD